MRSMPVVLVDPGREMTESIGGILIAPGIGPLTDGGLDEALGFAVGFWGIDAGADGLDLELAAGLSEERGAETRAIVGHDAADSNAKLGEVGDSLAKEAARRDSLFVREHGGEGDARVVVDGDVKKLPARAPGFVLRVAGDAMTRFADTRQFLDVDVQQVAGSRVFITHDGNRGLEHAHFVQPQPGQDTTHGGAAEGRGLRNPQARPALTPQAFHAGGQFRTRASRRMMGNANCDRASQQGSGDGNAPPTWRRSAG